MCQSGVFVFFFRGGEGFFEITWALGSLVLEFLAFFQMSMGVFREYKFDELIMRFIMQYI